MEETKYCSYKNGELSRGCKLCVKGRKLVLFITGICPRTCYFCPLSEQKFHKDVMYANERKISDMQELVEEAKISGAKGVGITGGDPLAKFERTLEAIKLLKEEFGKHFHIHLYTSLNLVDEDKIRKLEEVGLDEIRFHLDFDDDKLWSKIKFETKMTKVMEVPVIPGKDLKSMVEFVKDDVSYINLNELEYADAKHNKLSEMKFEAKDPLSNAIKGSEELAFEVMDKFPSVNIHYCTAMLKNSVQFINRLSVRAQNVKHAFDIVKGPALIRGVVTGEDVNEVYENVSKLFTCAIDKNRVVCSKGNAKKHCQKLKKMGYKVEVVEELASYDNFEIESEEL